MKPTIDLCLEWTIMSFNLGIVVKCFQFEPAWSHPLFATAPNSSFYIICALGPGFIARISRCVSTAIQEFSFEDSIGEPFELSNYAASASCCSISFGKLICVFIFRNISATFPSGVK